MKFLEFVCFEAIVPVLQSDNRNDVIIELISALDKAGRLGKNNRQKIAKAAIKRENEASTGMGRGVAVPHVKHAAVKNMVATIGQCSSGLDFAALDKQPVYSVILLVSPLDGPDKHLEAMEHIFKYLQQEKFRKFLRQSQNAAQIEDLLKEADETAHF